MHGAAQLRVARILSGAALERALGHETLDEEARSLSRCARAALAPSSLSMRPAMRCSSMSRAVQKPVIVAISCVSAVVSESFGYDDAGRKRPSLSRSKYITRDERMPQRSSTPGTSGGTVPRSSPTMGA